MDSGRALRIKAIHRRPAAKAPYSLLPEARSELLAAK